MTARERLLGMARADLVALPELVDELARCLTERTTTAAVLRRIAGSPALIRLDVFHLLDLRRKQDWFGHDPREENLTDQLGVTPLLEAWVRVLWEEVVELLELTEVATVRSEAAVLVEYWPFIEAADWGEELARDVIRITAEVRAALGIRPDYRPRCRKCKSVVIPVDADRRLTTWEACGYGACTGCDWTYPTGPALNALAQVQEPMPLAEISSLVGVPVKTLHRWYAEELIVPVNGAKRKRVFDLAAVRAVATVKFGRKMA